MAARRFTAGAWTFAQADAGRGHDPTGVRVLRVDLDPYADAVDLVLHAALSSAADDGTTVPTKGPRSDG